ncbi:DUF3320 domain-containing protein [Chitinophaga sp. sic0106]|uniref:DUF3320 domain-containing protein n=1 Tax=Chitinophaga sp. sic0106 TaxID=2854785 RepID=UPI001C472D79|nr:DUF3320 domain-containing protein [Chitinophaga sp. sic0106]MBV7529439.1 DUF3320 domain-containing protein [Chitinophaga sp. sic0106]
MIGPILSRLEASRKELLDLGLRNPLLNYKLPTGKGLHIVQEQSAAVYNILVRENKTMTFAGKTAAEAARTQELPLEAPAAPAKDPVTDTKLQTNENNVTLQHKLLQTYYAARTSVEEQGVNILYLSLGMLQWYETDSSQEVRLAPLILVPVLLDRGNVGDRFKLKYTLEEVGENISLQAKMKTDFNIHIPELPDQEDVDITAYFAAVETAITGYNRWKVIPDAIELGFFSFGKFMIYNDLDSDNWPNGQKPEEHPLIASLFGAGFQDPNPDIPENAFIDRDTNAAELFQVVDADSSQIMAMLAVQQGRNLVIQGPPGTGKSQTITNIIADAIGRGKKVLFVAEKLAALEVVKRRLDNIYLGEACLELHSHKANKKALHQELRRVLDLGKPAASRLQEELHLLDNTRDELNDYCLAINTEIQNSSLTPQQIIGNLLQLRQDTENVTLPRIAVPDISNWNAYTAGKAVALAERMQACLRMTGVPATAIFRGSMLTSLLPHEQANVKLILEEAITAAQQLQHRCAETATWLQLPAPDTFAAANSLVTICEVIASQPDIHEMNISHPGWLRQSQLIQEVLSAGEQAAALREQYKNLLIPEAWDQDLLQVRQDVLAHGEKWYKFLIGSWRRSKQQLAALCLQGLPNDNATRLQYVDDVMACRRFEAILKENAALTDGLFATRWEKLHSNWPVLNTAATWLQQLHQQIQQGTVPAAVIDCLQRQTDPVKATQEQQRLHQQIILTKEKLGAALQALQMEESKRLPLPPLQEQTFAAQQETLHEWHSHLPEITHTIAWNNISATAEKENLQCLTEAGLHWPAAGQYLKAALLKSWYEYLLEAAVRQYPELRQFNRSSHEELIRQFQRLDTLQLQYNRIRAALHHWEQMPKTEAGGQVNILKTEFNKKARHMPVRKLMQAAGWAIQAIKPVFMMSPMSIANFLPPESVEFDLVIFDEASQVRPVDALGAIMRGKQLVVVGDTRQLPPTSFFDTLTREIDDEENVTADMQSILGLCDAQGAPQRMLRWHYRSRHESLITLSNHEFYDNKLVIFPGPGTKEQAGLVFHHLADTAYDRGKTRTNPKEAERVADAVIAHAKTFPKQSLGVVAFSTSQREAISDALEVRRKAHPELESFFTSHHDEPFFVKNLENVQGDERDVIYISIGYGRTEEGYVAMSFGPLNNEGGERRLNVLITRAKLRCEVFTNITADDIDESRTQSYGIRALKSFLYYAQHGKLNYTEETGLPADSPFEENVAAALAAKGYTIRKQVGAKGFYIDMAVVDPDFPGRYLLGIECDGAAYHSARSARDRDRLRQQVLEGMGWKIHRIWSTDWFHHPEAELERLIAAIEAAKHAHQQADKAEEITAEEIAMERTVVEVPEEKTVPYQIASLPEDIREQELHQAPIGQLCNWIQQVVEVESPVHFDELARRMVEAAGVTRVGPRLREVLRHAVRHADAGKRIRIKGQFLWHVDLPSPLVRDRSELPASARKVNYIAVEEMGVALEKVVKDAVAIQPEAAVPFMAKMFGFSRVTEDMRTEFLKGIVASVENNVVQMDGDYLKA